MNAHARASTQIAANARSQGVVCSSSGAAARRLRPTWLHADGPDVCNGAALSGTNHCFVQPGSVDHAWQRRCARLSSALVQSTPRVQEWRWHGQARRNFSMTAFQSVCRVGLRWDVGWQDVDEIERYIHTHDAALAISGFSPLLPALFASLRSTRPPHSNGIGTSNEKGEVFAVGKYEISRSFYLFGCGCNTVRNT